MKIDTVLTVSNKKSLKLHNLINDFFMKLFVYEIGRWFR